MTVYVDEPDKPFGRMKMCHMVADTSDELREIARIIGVSAKWIQYPNSPREHFDISKGKRDQAIKNGAVPISNRDLGRFQIAKRKSFTWRPGMDIEIFRLETFQSMDYEHVHLCPDWDFLAIHDRSPEFESCSCTFPDLP